MTAPDPNRLIARLTRDKVTLDLKTVDLCFLAGRPPLRYGRIPAGSRHGLARHGGRVSECPVSARWSAAARWR